ncbi:MAG: rhomboid family intramembrane serine protease [Candidatus Aenigmarchaeota archaeon]|nr:rhomboid family intramembrane serine protease [Candidatus Aenigmarchaeota archaeon]
MRQTLALVAVTAVVFAAQMIVSGFTEAFLLDSSLVFVEPWRLVTSMFLHGDVTHIGYNMFALFLFGSILERELGRFYIPFYFIAGIVSGIVAVPFYAAALGASGAVYGVMGALASIRPKLIVFVMGVPMPMIAAAFVWLALDTVGFFSSDGIANAAHIGGLLFGAVVGFAFFRKPEEARRTRVFVDKGSFEDWEKRYMGNR